MRSQHEYRGHIFRYKYLLHLEPDSAPRVDVAQDSDNVSNVTPVLVLRASERFLKVTGRASRLSRTLGPHLSFAHTKERTLEQPVLTQ